VAVTKSSLEHSLTHFNARAEPADEESRGEFARAASNRDRRRSNRIESNRIESRDSPLRQRPRVENRSFHTITSP